MKQLNIAYLLACALLVSSHAAAKKPDWGGGAGTAVIGFGLVELTPQKSGGAAFVPTTFTFNYDIPKQYTQNLGAGQIVVIPASAAETYNDIPSSTFIAYTTAQKLLTDADFHMSASITINQPGLYMVGYGPWAGLITFDATKDGRETYKISGEAAEGGALRWIDQDAGDLTIINYSAIPNAQTKEPIVRVRMIRDKGLLAPSPTSAAPLSASGAPKEASSGALRLNPEAAERVKLIDAKW